LLRTVFMGTPEFAVPCLERLVEDGHELVAVVTQPDKPVGRKQSVLKASPVKEAALKLGVTNILQPVKAGETEFFEALEKISPDLIVVVAYGQLLPKNILDLPKYGCINVHSSLLPKYRGAAPMQWAIINGEKTTGVTTMYMDEGMDTGDILLKREVDITENMTYQELYDILRGLGAELLSVTIEKILKGTLERVPQDHKLASTVSIMKKEDGLIDWNKSAQEIHDLVRGTNPWPGAYTFYKGGRMKIWETRIPKEDELAELDLPAELTGLPRDTVSQKSVELTTVPHSDSLEDLAENVELEEMTDTTDFKRRTNLTQADTSARTDNNQKGIVAGTILKATRDGLIVATGKGLLKITEIQQASAKRMRVEQCWHNIDEGEVLG
jgi:methionyl-tRNA formyltransferase